MSKPQSYAKLAAGSLGVDERTVRRDLARGKKIAPDILADLTNTPLDKSVVLDELARTGLAEQRAKLAEMTPRRQADRVRPLSRLQAILDRRRLLRREQRPGCNRGRLPCANRRRA